MKLYKILNIHLIFNFIILVKLIIFLIYSFNVQKGYESFLISFDKYINSSFHNQFYLSGFKEFDLFFNISLVKYCFSFKFKLVEIEYNLYFYNRNEQLIIPSDLALYYDLHIFCHSKKKFNIYLDSIANIYKNKYFNCIEYFQLNEKIKLGIKIYNYYKKNITLYFLDNNIINYNYFNFINDTKFDPLYLDLEYKSLLKEINNNQNKNNSILLKKFFISFPNSELKEKLVINQNEWYFRNIFNHYFCFCYGKYCEFHNISEQCKYSVYLSIIDNSRHLYNKTDYLLADFLYGNRAPGDAYFVFKEMIKQNLSAHYFTERKDIYNEYNTSKKESLRVIPIIDKQYNITADFLEKYLNLFLRLKSVISGAEFFSIDNIFYNIEYITFICIGHGVNYFKPFLYTDYYGCKRYNKILLPSDKIIFIAKKYGWTDDNIIKIGLPKWDIFDNYAMEMNLLSNEKKELINKSIFIMFTWRELINGKNISTDYFNNIYKLLNNDLLLQILERKNITLSISLHHNLLREQYLINVKGRVKYINQEDILEYLTKSNLIISDFSSVIFDMIYQNKPFIMYIPDSNDKNIINIYKKEYFDVINGLKNDTIFFENKFFCIEDTINKIIYYINNDFKLENKLKKFYDNFNFKGKRHINNFINYLKFLS